MTTNKDLQCDQSRDCPDPVTHIDRKGYIYCEKHGQIRRMMQPCRRLTRDELKTIAAGNPVARY